jgi:GNAT superfamily N-acetyltransferase
MSPDFILRPAVIDDIAPAYAMFRRSIYGYLFRLGMVDEATAKDPPIAEAWRRQREWIEHLWRTSSENWVAVDQAGDLIGWAMSIERDGHLELTHFFVEPGRQGAGVGRALVEKAFPPGRGRHRTINATQDPSALSIYLSCGVHHVTDTVDVLLKPVPFDRTTDLEFRRLEVSETSVQEIIAIERTLLDFAREQDIRFMLANRPAWLASRNGTAVGYAFGVQPNPAGVEDFSPACGPMGALDPADIPALVDQVIDQAVDVSEFFITVPFMNQQAISHVLKRGGRIDPFYLMILSDSPTMKLDRYIHTSPSFIL